VVLCVAADEDEDEAAVEVDAHDEYCSPPPPLLRTAADALLLSPLPPSN
jgi:hypothetical protein